MFEGEEIKMKINEAAVNMYVNTIILGQYYKWLDEYIEQQVRKTKWKR